MLSESLITGAPGWLSQLSILLTFDFGSGHDFTVREIKPCIGLCTESEKPTWDSLSLSLSLSLFSATAPPLMLFFFLSK